MDGLNQFLIPQSSPYAINTSGVVDPYTFDFTYERDVIGNTKITALDAGKISAGTVKVGINLGSSSTGYLLLDGANNRIIVNDGTQDRVLVGYLANGF